MSGDRYVFAEPETVADAADAIDREDDLRTVMATKGGRRFVWSILTRARIFEPGLTGEYSMGRRDAALELRAELRRVVPGDFRTMEQENDT